MITPAKIERIAHLLAGTEPGWQTRFGTMAGLSRSYVSKMLSGARPMTQMALSNIIEAAMTEAKAARVRADTIEKTLGELLPTLQQARAMPPIDDGDSK